MGNDNIKTKLADLQERAIAHAIEEMEEAGLRGLASKEDRGDRAWLTKMCEKSLAVAVRVESFLALRERGPSFQAQHPDADEDAAQAAFIRRAEAQLQQVMARRRLDA